MNAEFIRAVAEAAVETLRIQCGLGAQALPSAADEVVTGEEAAVTAAIEIISPSFRGWLVLGFPEKTFLNAMNGMLGASHAVLDEELEDGAAELANMVLGLTRASVSARGTALARTLPQLLRRGAAASMELRKHSTSVVIPFRSDGGGFWVELIIGL